MSDNKNIKLEVNNLKISFRTNNGRVQAVRDISFNLYEGETLAIVGESGSGKSVTSRAVMGILAPNSIVESGEILYEGKDLLQISEEEFHELRGDKLAMVFQDPLSSLNPIVKIGRQLTEAMILKNRLVRKENKSKLSKAFKILAKNIDYALNAKEDKNVKSQNKQNLNTFKKFVRNFIVMQNAYNISIERITYAIEELESAIVLLENNVKTSRLNKNLSHASDFIIAAKNQFTIQEDSNLFNEVKDVLAKIAQENYETDNVLASIKNIKNNLVEIKQSQVPNFFSLAFYLLENKEIPSVSIDELNYLTRKYLDDKFMLSYIKDLEKGVKNAFDNNNEAKKEAIVKLNDFIKYLDANSVLDKKDISLKLKDVLPYVAKCENALKIGKDTYTVTYANAIKKQINTYFGAEKINEKNRKKYEKEKQKFDKIIAKGKKPSYTVAEVIKIDPELSKSNVYKLTRKLISNYEKEIKQYETFDVEAYTVSIIDYLKELSANIVKKVSKRSAKEKAIRLMEEVGIPEPQKRFKQYPFQFSGGMRQRIVIAIALSANPDILICDEPTTALDVTIQAQILELINKLKKERNLSIIFITHDLGVVANMADRIAVMYAGKIVEHATTDELFYDPKHPYTWALLASIPDLDTKETLAPIPGTPPNMIYPPKGDAFAARNKYAMKIDFEKQPPLFKVSETHYAATWLLHPNAPKVTPPSIVMERIERMKNSKEVSKNGK